LHRVEVSALEPCTFCVTTAGRQSARDLGSDTPRQLSPDRDDGVV